MVRARLPPARLTPPMWSGPVPEDGEARVFPTFKAVFLVTGLPGRRLF